MKDDLHIKVLRCVHENPNGITITEIAEKLKVGKELIKWISDECNTGGMKFWRIGRNNNNEWIITLSMEGRAILLQHDELNEARKSSEEAKKESQIAKKIAIAAIVIGIIVGFFDITSPVTLNEKQLNNIQAELDSIESKLIDTNMSLDEIKNKNYLNPEIEHELKPVIDSILIETQSNNYNLKRIKRILELIKKQD